MLQSYLSKWQYFFAELGNPSLKNSFYLLLFVSLIFFIWEIVLPWRKTQKIMRKDFWLDFFYMIFNMQLFPLIGFSLAAKIVHLNFISIQHAIGINSLIIFNIQSWPWWFQLLAMFLIRDFSHWNIHRLLHRVPLFWEMHKVHHSVEQMGFAAHLRYHWFENIIYRGLEFLPLALLGFSVRDFTIVYITSLVMGYFNHSNISLALGPLKYVFNNPQMHIWHHAKDLPNKNGVNFGLTLSCWDYIFKTDYIPHDGKDAELGFENLEQFPGKFWKQMIYPLGKKY